jgi:hypothetical protein
MLIEVRLRLGKGLCQNIWAKLFHRIPAVLRNPRNPHFSPPEKTAASVVEPMLNVEEERAGHIFIV